MNSRNSFEAHGALYKKGIAIGSSDIRTDTMSFVFRKEQFTFPTLKCFHLSFFNGYFYEAKVKALRKLKTMLEKNDGKR